ncbi:MAG TPA: orc1/cdc6 family replication initiation protein [Candidatus Nanoarchaeia archaeon]|nr:orc1/cdc6 family replication initiation protein [Candidatus Nanoarchaeia archaeon]
MVSQVQSFFEHFLKENFIFQNKKFLQANYLPDLVMHRDDFMREMASILAPALKGDRPSNLFIYGKTGTGKTLITRRVTDDMERIAKENNIPLRVIYVNCKLRRVADTEYRLIAQLAREFGRVLPATGLPTDSVYSIFYELLDSKEQLVLLVLDEIDQLAKRAGDNLLYNLTRINTELKHAQLCLIGISNDLVFVDQLDARVKSSLSEEELLFPPYNAVQIHAILQERANKSFKENALQPGVLEKCAAYAAGEHGDARRALELLRVAGEIAERKSCQYVEIKHIDEAQEKIDRDRLYDLTLNQPRQYQALMYALLTLGLKQQSIVTGELYGVYEQTCHRLKLRPLTQRRISDVIGEFEMLGIAQTRVVSKGRYGRSRNIVLAVPRVSLPKMKELLVSSLGLNELEQV